MSTAAEPGLAHVALSVTDLARANRFYLHVLGLREMPRPDLGIPGSHRLWRELHWAITYQGGDYVRLVSDIIARTGRRIASAWPAAAPPPAPTAAGTGPP